MQCLGWCGKVHQVPYTMYTGTWCSTMVPVVTAALFGWAITVKSLFLYHLNKPSSSSMCWEHTTCKRHLQANCTISYAEGTRVRDKPFCSISIKFQKKVFVFPLWASQMNTCLSTTSLRLVPPVLVGCVKSLQNYGDTLAWKLQGQWKRPPEAGASVLRHCWKGHSSTPQEPCSRNQYPAKAEGKTDIAWLIPSRIDLYNEPTQGWVWFKGQTITNPGIS